MVGEFISDLQQFFYTRAERCPMTPEYTRLNQEFLAKFDCLREYLGAEKWNAFEEIVHGIESQVELAAYKQGFSDGMRFTKYLQAEEVLG